MAICYGNCQTFGIVSYLSANKTFCDKYWLLKIPAICEFVNESAAIMHEGFWQFCDLFICQRIRDDNRFGYDLSSDVISGYLPARAQIVWIPNMFF